jgi:hypothetical protein
VVKDLAPQIFRNPTYVDSADYDLDAPTTWKVGLFIDRLDLFRLHGSLYMI